MSVPGESAYLFRVLALIGMLNAAVGAWYYLRIITTMYLRTSIRPVTTPGSTGGLIALAACVVLTVGLSIPPASSWLLRSARLGAEPAAQPQDVAAIQR
jgi:NADH-quinone oxidoreductase subunit N